MSFSVWLVSLITSSDCCWDLLLILILYLFLLQTNFRYVYKLRYGDNIYTGELQVKGMTKPAKKAEDEEPTEERKVVEQLVEEIETMLDDADVTKSPEKVDVERENFECDKCGKNYGTKGSLRTHKYNHIKKEMAEESKDVEEMVDNEVTIVENIDNPMEEKAKFDCEQCGKTYGTKGSLRTHKYIHIKKDLKLEEVQDKTDQSENSKDENSCIQTDQSDSKDENKGQTFEEKYKASLVATDEVEMINESIDKSLLGEQSKVEPMPEDNSELDKCIDSLTEQVDDGSWVCKKCGKKDKSKFHLRRHAETHVEGFKHPCTFCEKEFSQRALVKAHVLRNHSEERPPKPFTCDICNMPSTSTLAVKVHKQRKHLGIFV